MGDIYLWRIFCVTENSFKYLWDNTPPTVCPLNNSHTTRSGSVNELTNVNIYRTVVPTESPYTLTQYNLYRCNTTSGNITFNLVFNANFNKDRIIVIQKLSASNTLTILPESGKTINGGANIILTLDKSSVNLTSNGDGNWSTITSDLIDIEDFMSYDDANVSLIANGNKGSILVNNGTDVSYHGVGANNTFLISNSSQPLGLQWATLANVGNSKLISVFDSTSTSNAGASYKVLYRVVFPGSLSFNLSICYILCDRNTGQLGKLRLVNYNTGLIMAENLNINDTYHIETMNTITNIPTELSIIELQGANCKIFGLLLM